jgi:hypothetical protein
MASLTPGFSGSYPPEAVTFLLRKLTMERTPLKERERLIQSGKRHYSEMIGPEDAPSRQRMQLFKQCLAENGRRLAEDVVKLAAGLAASASNARLTLVSIARAGTPIGVLVWHRLRRAYPHLSIAHYSISVIRDHGVDAAALQEILRHHPADSIRFIDGWTGKGTIAHELASSIQENAALPADLSAGLWVPLDVCGAASWAASSSDYVIPPSLLGGTISGLVSRSVLLSKDRAGPQLHGCVELLDLRKYDVTNWFIRHQMAIIDGLPVPASVADASGGNAQWQLAKEFLTQVHTETGVKDKNRVKLGIGETVRVLLRRLPREIWLSDKAPSADAAIVRQLAFLRNVPLQIRLGIPFAAVAIIADASPASDAS